MAILYIAIPAATADLIQINLTAQISQVDDPYDLLGGQAEVGNIISGHYKYNSSTPDTNDSPNVITGIMNPLVGLNCKLVILKLKRIQIM